MSEQPRRHVPVPEKVAALKRHLLEGTAVSEICDELGVKPTVFYSWQKLLFENAHLAFENGRKSKVAEDAKEKKIAAGKGDIAIPFGSEFALPEIGAARRQTSRVPGAFSKQTMGE